MQSLHWLQHTGGERDRCGDRGQGEECGICDNEALGVPRRLLRAAPGVRPQPVGEPLQQELNDRVLVRGHHAAHDDLHCA